MENQNRITINEKGFIKNLSRLGFTKNQSFAEIFTNSIDAKANKIIIEKNKKDIRIIDNGLGMNQSELRNKYDLMKQRQRDRDTTGCAGIGGTTSEFILAKIKSVVITKKSESDEISVAEVDWNRVYTEQKLFDSILFRKPTDEELNLFLSERDNDHGTTTILYYAKDDENELTNILKEQFDPKKKKDIPHCERFDIIFGHKNCEFIFKHWKTKNKEISLELYNLNKYREEDMNYLFKDYDIQIHKEINSGNIIYICDGRIIDIHGSTSRGKKTYKKTLTNYIKNCETDKLGILKLNLYNPYDDNRFDINNPKIPGAGQSLNNYEKKFFRLKENAFVDREFIQEMQIYRNNHYLGIKKICNRNSARADGKTGNKLFYTRSFIEFFVESNEDEIEISPIDEIFGIQLNKNQNNQDNIPIPLGRLIEGLIEEFHLETWEYFQNIIKDFERNKEIITKENICNDLFIKSKLLIEGNFNNDTQSVINELTSCIIDLENYQELFHYINTLGTNKIKLVSKLNNFIKACKIIEKVYYNKVKNPRLISKIISENKELLENIEEKDYINLSLSELKGLIRKIKNDKEHVEQERIEQERIEQERIEQERLNKERLEQERIEQERINKERLEQERLEHERLNKEKTEQERLNKEKTEQERLNKEKTEQENLNGELNEREKINKQERLINEYINKIKDIFCEAKSQLNKEMYESLINYKYE